MTPIEQAHFLLKEEGPPEAWQHATRMAVDAHLVSDWDICDYWLEVQDELRLVAPRPGPGDLDIYRSAQLLLGTHGREAALDHAVQSGAALIGDLTGQAVWSRIYEAIVVLSREKPGDEKHLQ